MFEIACASSALRTGLAHAIADNGSECINPVEIAEFYKASAFRSISGTRLNQSFRFVSFLRIA